MFNKLREQPEDVKKKIALTLSGVVSVIIFIFWLSYTIDEVKGVAIETKETSTSMWSEANDSLANVFGSVQEQFGNIKKTFSQIEEYQLNKKTE